MSAQRYVSLYNVFMVDTLRKPGRRAERSKQAILDATRELLAEQGDVGSLTVEAVAARSGVAKTTIYVKDWRPELMDELYGAVNDYIEGGGRFGEFTASTLVGVAALYEPWCLVEIDAVAVVA